MPAVNILIKPASSACNMNCTYCFYKDVAQNRENDFEGMLSLETMEQLIQTGLEFSEGVCTFAFQGGEPTLAGISFYQAVVDLQKKYAKSNVKIQNAIQTNGYCIDDDWAKFLADEHFLVGVSLDGPAEVHNLNRKNSLGKNTFNRVMRTIELFDKYGVEYNILSVVTGQSARYIERIYNFYKRKGFRWIQFIPCLEPLGEERGLQPYHLSYQAYGEYLIRLFDLWYQDLCNGQYISIRHLDNWIGILMGRQPEACNMTGHCSVQFVVEGDGGVYPCDFYVLDEWRLGTAGKESFQEMLNSERAQMFIRESFLVPEECRTCPAYPLCRNGCRRDRLALPDGKTGRNYYCEAYRRFFRERGNILQRAAWMLQGYQQR